ncbi:diguanylate cyclase domain-containing protein [Geminocystis sp. NIES-3709]|uniref:diguanylate cyclase domain-containing protein n=1 Tax=Geminocystis sp. NIES-3709 TaxID=1617448 RepID=UPI0005FCBE04|nr:diguanylate cyclase [Geminocystis sp. NIES-3709]BAQ66083.1 diguanylate cyclase/phosphodiesterase with PAS/PAC sensor [Geminocystis sp. NIES-3709]
MNYKSSEPNHNVKNQSEQLTSNLRETLLDYQKKIAEENREEGQYLYLLIIEDGSDKRLIYLTDEMYEIGRRHDAEIIFHDQAVSRNHGTIVKEYNQEENLFFYKIFDGDLSGHTSTNGLIINNKKYQNKYLEHGDLIQLSKKAKARYFVIDKDSQIKDFLNFVNSENNNEILIDKDLESYAKKTLDYPPFNLDIGNDLSLEKENINEYISKLSSFAELSPYPIVEINLQGKLTYYNQAASLLFPKLADEKMSHPVLSNLLKAEHKIHGNLFVRELHYHNKIFEQYIHYLPELKLIRSYIFDFTERKQIEAKLKDSEAKYRAVIEQISEGIILFTAEDFLIIECNISATKILKYPLKDLIHENIELFLASKQQEFRQNLQVLRISKISFTQELKLKVKNDEPVDVELSVSVIIYEDKLVFCSVFRDISERKKLENKLKYQAYHDSLTGLYKRNFFLHCFAKNIARAKRKKMVIGIMFFDVDHFKQINDNYGHDIGDLLLQQFSQRLQHSLRESDCLARWGGDEFVALLPDISSQDDLMIIIDRVIKSIRNPFACNGVIIRTSTSIGVAIYPKHGEDIDSLLKKADEALYTTKRNGRNGYTIYI